MSIIRSCYRDITRVSNAWKVGRVRAALVITTAGLLLWSGCGGGKTTPTEPGTAVPIEISPNPATLLVGGTQLFSADVEANTQLTWSVVEGPSGGHIDEVGRYTGPSVAGTYHVSLSTRADPSRSATAVVMVKDYSYTFVPLPGTPPDSLGPTTLLRDGTVLSTATLTLRFHPTTLLFTPEPVNLDARLGILLQDGRVLLCTPNLSGPCQVYDPLDRTVSLTAAPALSVNGSSETLLEDGRVLFAGGSAQVCSVCNHPIITTASAQVYQPGTADFAKLSNMTTARSNHSAVRLPTGEILIVGGDYIGWGTLSCGTVCFPTLASAETLESDIFKRISPLNVSRAGAGAVLLPDNSVLILGGTTGIGMEAAPGSPLASVERFDPVSQTFKQAGSLAVPRGCVSATLLSNGKVLVLGGNQPGVPSATAEIYDPVAGTSISISNMLTARNCSTALRLLDGRVLVGNYKPELFE